MHAIKYVLSMDGAAVGDAHFEGARDFYRDNALFLDAANGDPDENAAQTRLDKLIFLSEIMFADKDIEEAYTLRLGCLKTSLLK